MVIILSQSILIRFQSSMALWILAQSSAVNDAQKKTVKFWTRASQDVGVLQHIYLSFSCIDTVVAILSDPAVAVVAHGNLKSSRSHHKTKVFPPIDTVCCILHINILEQGRPT